MSSFEYERDAVRVRAKCVKLSGAEVARKFSIDPNLTSFEILCSILTRAFDVGETYFIHFLSSDEWVPLISDWDLDAAIISSSEPHLNLKISESNRRDFEPHRDATSIGVNYIRKHVEKTLPSITQRFQKALSVAEDSLLKSTSSIASSSTPRPIVRNRPLSERDFQTFLNGVGELTRPRELRLAVYQGGLEPPLRKVAWKHILGVYPLGLNGAQRLEYIKDKSKEYYNLKKTWKDIMLQDSMTKEIKYISNMVRKDVFRTDRHHPFYAGDDNKNVSTLFDILTTYALNHPTVGYCQGMSDLLSPILVTMLDEAQSYIAFCALMKRLKFNFLTDGKSMTKKFNHLSEGIMYYDPEFFAYLKLHNADDLLFCYRWLILEMKREFPFEESCRVLEVLWSSLPPTYPDGVNRALDLFEVRFGDNLSPVSKMMISSRKSMDTNYARVAALRKRTGSTDILLGSGKNSAMKHRAFSMESGRPRIQSAGSAEDKSTFERDSDNVLRGTNSEKGKKVVTDLHDFYKLTSVKQTNSAVAVKPITQNPPKPTENSEKEKDSIDHKDKTDLQESLEDPFDSNIVGYSQANGNNLSIVCNRLPPPSEFGDGNPFLIFLCISILMQHRAHVLAQKFDYQEIAMYFDRFIRRHNVEKTLTVARKLFAEYLNGDWSQVQKNSRETSNAC